MLDRPTINIICSSVGNYWRELLKRRVERDYFESLFAAGQGTSVKASFCTLGFLHTFFPVQSGFQVTEGVAAIRFAGNKPLWIRNCEGIWNPVSVLVFQKTASSKNELFPVEDILRAIVTRMLDSLYLIVVELDGRNVNLKMANVLDALSCVHVVARGGVHAAINCKAFLRQTPNLTVNPRNQLNSMVGIYREVVQKTIAAEKTECERLSDACVNFARMHKVLVASRRHQKILDIR